MHPQAEEDTVGRRLMRFTGETALCKTSGVQDVLGHARARSLRHDIIAKEPRSNNV